MLPFALPVLQRMHLDRRPAVRAQAEASAEHDAGRGALGAGGQGGHVGAADVEAELELAAGRIPHLHAELRLDAGGRGVHRTGSHGCPFAAAA